MLTRPNLISRFIPLAVANCLVFALLCAGAAVCLAQQEVTPKRGFQPGSSYALGDIETVNTTNGNVMLRLPLGSLPAGRGGSTGPGVTLNYNSKLWDSRVEYRTLPVQPDPNDPNSALIPVSLLQVGEGGWRLGLSYALELTDRDDQYQPAASPPCTLDSSYRWRLRVVAPDGGAHDMRPVGYSDYQNNGHYKIHPNGLQYFRAPNGSGCHESFSQASITGVWYWASDGSNVRLHIGGYDGDTNWQNNPWTLYLPDGGRVTGGNTPQRFYDRNGNYSEIQNVTLPDGRGATRLVDQLGRYVQIDGDLYLPRTYVRVKGANATELVWTIVWKDVWVQKQYRVTDELGYTQGPETLYHTLTVVDKVIVPDPHGEGERSYTFGYNAPSTQPASGEYTDGWGEVNAVTLPTGAAASYQWVQDGPQPLTPFWRDVLANAPHTKTLTYQREYDGQSSPTTETWTYQFWNMGSVITGPDGGTSSEAFHDVTDAVSTQSGLSYLSARPDGTLVERIWLNKNLVKTEFTSIRDASGNLIKTAIKDYQYDCYGNVKSAAEYDWVSYASVPRPYGRPTGLPPGAQPKRLTTNSYYHEPCMITNAPRILNAVKSTEVSDGAALLSRAEVFYDDPFNTGNLTEQRRWDSAKGTLAAPDANGSRLNGGNSVSTSYQYDSYGNRRLSTDARGVQTKFVYGPVDGHSDLYPTEALAADNHPSLRLTTQTQYDFQTGLVTRVTDADNNVAAATTYDAFGRPVLSCAADNVPATKTCRKTEYSDSLRRVVVRADLDAAGDEKLVTVEHYDQLGRVRLSRRLENSSTQQAADETHGVKVQTRYMYGGQNGYQLVSNPYRAAYSHQAGTEGSMGWSRAKSDRGGRPIEAQTFNGAALPAPWGTNASSSGAVTTAYDAEITTVTDQAGKVRRSVTSGLGLLARVDEPDGNGNLDNAGSPVQPTHHTYDALGNLTQVQQGAQTRTFAYSSLSRLTSAMNPESGTVSYTYDANGNLKTKTDARGVTITYTYDELNRNTHVDYSDTPSINPDVSRFYDNPAAGTYSKGRFWHDYAGGDYYTTGQTVEHTAIDSYDALGRPLVKRQLFKAAGVWGTTYQTSRQYNRAGGVISQTYPSGRAVSYGYDAAGRLASFAGNLGDGTQRTYADQISYEEAGRMREERFGTQTPLYHKLNYNRRGQLYDVRLSTAGAAQDEWDWNRGRLALYYGAPLAPHGQSNQSNNGNVARAEHWVPTDANSPYGAGGQGPWVIRATNYHYDSLNRLEWAAEVKLESGVAGEAPSYRQAYIYDRWGNRRIDAGGTWLGQSTNPPDPRVNETEFEMGEAASTNRLLAPGDLARPEVERLMRYDNAGNLVKDSFTGAGGRAYDAENRMISGVGASPLTGGTFNNRFAYDGDGRRVRRVTESGEVWQVYGVGGELVAEYAAAGEAWSPRKEYGYRAGELLVVADEAPAGASNMAAGRPATQSSDGWGGVAQRAADGNTSGDWAQNSVTHTELNAQAWWQVDLGSVRQVGEIRVWNRTDCCAERLTNFYVFVSDAPFASTSLSATINQAGVSSHHTSGQGGRPTTIAANRTGRYVRVQLAGTDYLSLAEVQVMAGGGAAPGGDAVSGFSAAQNPAGPWAYGYKPAGGSFTPLPAASTYFGAGTATWALPGQPCCPMVTKNTTGSTLAYPNAPSIVQPADTLNLHPGQAGERAVVRWTAPQSGAYTFAGRFQGIDTNGPTTDVKIEHDGAALFTGQVSGYGAQAAFSVTRTVGAGEAVEFSVGYGANLTYDSDSTGLQATITGGPATAGPEVRWLVSDHLGTPRMTVDQTGSLTGIRRHDYLPFGEEIAAGVGGRTTAQGYGQPSGIRKRWAQLERDDETGLDFAQARYYSPAMGRFTSPDEFTGGPDELFDFVDDAADNPTFYADLGNPQSLNKYQYTYNNPINLIDPDGHCPDCPVTGTSSIELFIQIVKNPGKALDVVQTIISGVGVIPGPGEAADGVNATISGARGNYGEAALDAAGGLGPAGSVVAVGNRIRKIAGKADDVAEAADRGVDAVKGSSRAARRETMRQEGIPTSQQPARQSGNSRVGRSYDYNVPKRGGGSKKKTVTDDPRPRGRANRHGPHWEAGTSKPGGQRDPQGRTRMQNQDEGRKKKRVGY